MPSEIEIVQPPSGDIYASLRELNPEPIEEEVQEELPEEESREPPAPVPDLMSLSNLDTVTADSISVESTSSQLRNMTSLSNLTRLQVDNRASIEDQTTTSKPEVEPEVEPEDDDFGDFEEAPPLPPTETEFVSKIDQLKSLSLNVTYDEPKQENNNSNLSAEVHEIPLHEAASDGKEETAEDSKKSFELLSGLDFSSPLSTVDQKESCASGMQLASVMSLDLPDIEIPPPFPEDSISAELPLDTTSADETGLDRTVLANETLKPETDNNQSEDVVSTASDCAINQIDPESADMADNVTETSTEDSINPHTIPSSASLGPVSWDVIHTDELPPIENESVEEVAKEIYVQPVHVTKPNSKPILKPKKTVLDDARPVWNRLINECLSILRNGVKPA